MRPVNIQKIKYADNVVSKRRQRLKLKIWSICLVLILTLGGVVYGLFYTEWLRVNSIVLEGLSEQHKVQVRDLINNKLSRSFLGIPVGQNLLFTSASSLQAELSEQFSFLKNVSVGKDYPHSFSVIGVERQAEGVWCFNVGDIEDTKLSCKYFDHDGIAWGGAMSSSGFLLLGVDDMRVSPDSEMDSLEVDIGFLKAIQLVVPTLSEQGIKIKKVTIPKESFTEFDLNVNEGYVLKFSLDSNIQDQLEVYRIFREQKLKDIEPKPSYLDFRFDGRVYFK